MKVLIWLTIFFQTTLLFTQQIRTDDFKFKNSYWYYRKDGNQEKPTVNSGMLHLKLENAISTEYCNTEIYDPSPEPYSPGTQIEIRLKGSPQHIGSRGWGFWDGDLFELLSDYDVAWIMQQKSLDPDPNYNWFFFGVDGDLLSNRQTIDLFPLVNETEWHTYKIFWRADSTFLFIDGDQKFVSTSHLPDENMRFDVWIDNRVVNLSNPFNFWNNNSNGSELFIDYVQISGIEGPAIKRKIDGNIICWDSPNTYPLGESETLWRSYDFFTKALGEGLIFITGDAERYDEQNDDDLKLILNGHDFGWNTENSLNGNILLGDGKSISIPWIFDKGFQELELISDITPFLRDVIILHSENGSVIFNNEYNSNPTSTDSLWQMINFTTTELMKITFLVSGSGKTGDKMRAQISDTFYSYYGENGINGAELMAMPKSIVFTEVLQPGNHTFKIYSQGTPRLFNAAAYGVKVSNVDLNIFLEGPYNGSRMMNAANSTGINIPREQPFDKEPWNYHGNEKISEMPVNCVDWILVELRDNAVLPQKSYFAAALLKSDGRIICPSGGDLLLYGVETGNYYVTLHHRNHLKVMSASQIQIN